MILPVVAANVRGPRHYDLYLQQVNAKATTVGRCFANPIPIIQAIAVQKVLYSWGVTLDSWHIPAIFALCRIVISIHAKAMGTC